MFYLQVLGCHIARNESNVDAEGFSVYSPFSDNSETGCNCFRPFYGGYCLATCASASNIVNHEVTFTQGYGTIASQCSDGNYVFGTGIESSWSQNDLFTYARVATIPNQASLVTEAGLCAIPSADKLSILTRIRSSKSKVDAQSNESIVNGVTCVLLS